MNSTGQTESLRRAALTVHALHERDRSWMLAALPSEARARLAPVLAELEELGIPRDASFLAEVVAAPAAATTPQEDLWPAELDDSGVAGLEHVLAREPAGVTATLLGIREWRWTPRLLAALDSVRRREIEAQRLRRPPGARVGQAVMQALQSQLAQDSPAPGPGAVSGWRRVLGRVRGRA